MLNFVFVELYRFNCCLFNLKLSNNDLCINFTFIVADNPNRESQGGSSATLSPVICEECLKLLISSSFFQDAYVSRWMSECAQIKTTCVSLFEKFLIRRGTCGAVRQLSPSPCLSRCLFKLHQPLSIFPLIYYFQINFKSFDVCAQPN